MAQVIKFYKNANEQDIVLNLSFQNNTNNSIENINDDIFTFDSKPTELISVEFNMTLNLDVFTDIAPFEEIDPELSCKYYLSFVSDTSRLQRLAHNRGQLLYSEWLLNKALTTIF